MKPLTQKQREALRYGQIIRTLRGCKGQLQWLFNYHGVNSYTAAETISNIDVLEFETTYKYRQNIKPK